MGFTKPIDLFGLGEGIGERDLFSDEFLQMDEIELPAIVIHLKGFDADGGAVAGGLMDDAAFTQQTGGEKDGAGVFVGDEKILSKPPVEIIKPGSPGDVIINPQGTRIDNRIAAGLLFEEGGTIEDDVSNLVLGLAVINFDVEAEGQLAEVTTEGSEKIGHLGGGVAIGIEEVVSHARNGEAFGCGPIAQEEGIGEGCAESGAHDGKVDGGEMAGDDSPIDSTRPGREIDAEGAFGVRNEFKNLFRSHGRVPGEDRGSG